MKESKKMDKYLKLSLELNEILNMRVTVIPTVIGALETVSKDLEKLQQVSS